MRFGNYFKATLITFLFIVPVCLSGQEIRGLRVYVDLAAGTYLKFPKPIDGIEGNFREKGYNFKNRSGGNAMNIVPPTDRVLEPAEIEISEGGRNHLFLITPYPKKYDPNIDPPFDYIFDNTDKLKKFAQQAELDRTSNPVTSQPPTKPKTPEIAPQPVQVQTPDVSTQPVTSTKTKVEEKKIPVPEKTVSDGYNEAITAGDKAFNEQNYTLAKQSYTEAMRIRLNEKYPFNRLQQIVAIEEQAEANRQKEIEKQKAINASFSQEVQKADRYLLNNEYSLARASYSKALEIKPDDAYPKNKIGDIDSLVKDILAKQEAQRISDEQAKKALAAEAEITNRYKAAVAKGDKAFAAGKYDEARLAYSDAQKIKPGEKYPDQKLTEIADVQNEKEAAAAEKLIKDKEKETTAKYDAFMNKGNAALLNKQFDIAKTNYNAALELRPNDKTAADRLLETDDAINKSKAAELEKANLAKQKQVDDSYNAAIIRADKAYNAKNFETAKTEYYNAQKLKPAELYPQSRLTEIDRQQAEIAARINKEKEIADTYKNAISAADKAFAAKNYTDAKLAYNQALTAKDGDPYARGKLAAIEKIEEDLSIKASQEALQALNNRYDSVVAIADKKYAAQDFAGAKETYLEAIDLIPNKGYPNSQLRLIERKEFEKAEQEKTIKYNAIISKANEAFAAKSYDLAKNYYNEALTVKPDEAFPKKQIDIINDPGELERIGKREELSQYNQLVNQGDASFKEGKFEEAKAKYEQANKIKANVPYVTFKINQINDTVNTIAGETRRRELEEQQKATDEKFNDIMAKADKAFNAGKLAESKQLFSDALALKPEDNGAKDKMASVNQAIKEKDDEAAALLLKKQKEEELNRRFTEWVKKGDDSFNAMRYEEAKPSYDSAVLLRPDDKYTKSQLTLIEKNLIARSDSAKKADAAKIKKEEAVANYDSAVQRADKAFDARLYFEARSGYKDALAIKPGEQYPASRLAEIEKALATENAVSSSTTSAAGNKSKVDSSVSMPVTGVVPASTVSASTGKTDNKPVQKAPAPGIPVTPALSKESGRQTTPQALALPYTQAEFFKRYNTINFREPPVGQKYVADAFFEEDTLENFNLCQSILQEPARLDISDSSNNVKLTLEAINFEGSKVYLKLKIQNFGTKEFLTGRMLFTWYRKAENKVDYYAAYLSAFPYLLPGKDYTIIYVTRSSNPTPGEEFEFIMDDRLKTTRLTLKIPSETYISEYER